MHTEGPARAALHESVGYHTRTDWLESRLHLLSKLGIFSAMLAGRALRPGVVPTHRHL
ncbi:MAG: hypothetical protein ACJ8BW_28600 [Ktedonobacteraceae bacterium]